MNTPSSDASSDEQKSERYIRTLEGDMEVVKQGGAPDLVPLRTSGIAAPIQTVSEPVLLSPPPPPQIEPQPLPTVESQPAPHVQVGPDEEGRIETYSSDFSNRLVDTHATFTQVLAAEQDAGPHEIVEDKEGEKKHSIRTLLYLLASAILVVSGGAGAIYAYIAYRNATMPIVLSPVVQSPIFTEDRVQVSGAGAALLQTFEQAVANPPLTPGSFRLIAPVEVATTTGEDIFSKLPLSAPAVVLRNIGPETSIAGAVNVNGNQTPFFILSVLSYGDTFAGMLSWEPLMLSALAPLFPPYPIPTVATTTVTTTATTSTKAAQKKSPAAKVATTTSAATIPPPLFVAGFHDETINNHDVRIYRDSQNRSVITYGYWNQKTLIIARDPAAFSQILTRLASTHAASQ